MKAEIKTEWVKALRSGNYTQGRSVLKFVLDKDTRWCCLGVLDNILPTGYKKKYPEWDAAASLDERTLAYCGLTNNDQDYLIRLNDIESASFPTIAGYIEKNL